MSKARARFIIFISVLFVTLVLNYRCKPSEENLDHIQNEGRIQSFKKTGEIAEGFSEGESNSFLSINSICSDEKNNLYVADSGWNRIFKFDSNGHSITSFGREGQGPGEFLGDGKPFQLRMSFGNDGNLYILDLGASRINVFSSVELPQKF